MFSAYMRLHHEWLKRTEVSLRTTVDRQEPGTFFSVTPDYTWSCRLWTRMVIVRFFPRHGKKRTYRGKGTKNTAIDNSVRRTWKVQTRKAAMEEALKSFRTDSL